MEKVSREERLQERGGGGGQASRGRIRMLISGVVLQATLHGRADWKTNDLSS